MVLTRDEELDQGVKKEGQGIYILGIGDEDLPEYPAWRYHDLFPPIVVQNEEEDKHAKLQGYGDADVPITGVQQLSNWRHDLEDMTPKQLVLFAKEEFNIDLPVEAGDYRLVRAMWRLMHIAPQHQGRITLLAQSVEMDYDETVEQILKAAEDMEFTLTKEVTI